MTTLRRTALAAGICLLLSATVPLAASAQDRRADKRLTPGTPAAGEITSADHLNLNDGTRSAAWTLALDAGQAVSIEGTAGFCGRLSLFSEDAGRLTLRATTESGCREDDGRQRIARSLVATRDGRYTVVFSGRTSSDYGPYSLAVRPVATTAGETLATGDSREALLTGDTQTLRLKIDTAGRYRIDVRSGEFDPVASLRGPGVELSDDDGGDEMDARINAWLEPGEYRLEVGRIGDSGGLYEVEVTHREVNLPPGVELQNGGALAAGGIVGLVQGEGSDYTLRIDRRSRVAFALDSEEFDPRIDISGPDTRMADDDSGDGVQARLVVTLEPGDYTVRIGDATGSGGGLFRLQTDITPASGAAPVLARGVAHAGRLDAGEQARFPLTVTRAGRHVITMTSGEFDSVLYLIRDGELVGMDDDGGGDNNARLEEDLVPGRYEVIATGYDGAHGAYRLTLEN